MDTTQRNNIRNNILLIDSTTESGLVEEKSVSQIAQEMFDSRTSSPLYDPYMGEVISLNSFKRRRPMKSKCIKAISDITETVKFDRLVSDKDYHPKVFSSERYDTGTIKGVGLAPERSFVPDIFAFASSLLSFAIMCVSHSPQYNMKLHDKGILCLDPSLEERWVTAKSVQDIETRMRLIFDERDEDWLVRDENGVYIDASKVGELRFQPEFSWLITTRYLSSLSRKCTFAGPNVILAMLVPNDSAAFESEMRQWTDDVGAIFQSNPVMRDNIVAAALGESHLAAMMGLVENEKTSRLIKEGIIELLPSFEKSVCERGRVLMPFLDHYRENKMVVDEDISIRQVYEQEDVESYLEALASGVPMEDIFA